MSRFRVPLHNNPGEADDIKNLVIMKRLLAAADQGTLGKKVCGPCRHRQGRSSLHHHRLNDRPNPCAALMNVESRYNDGQSLGKMVINGERSD